MREAVRSRLVRLPVFPRQRSNARVRQAHPANWMSAHSSDIQWSSPRTPSAPPVPAPRGNTSFFRPSPHPFKRRSLRDGRSVLHRWHRRAPCPTRGAPGFLTRDGIWAGDESCAIGLIRVIGPKTRVIPGMPESMVTRELVQGRSLRSVRTLRAMHWTDLRVW